MRKSLATPGLVAVGGALVLLFVAGVRREAFPLGVPGEWEWLRITARASALDVLLAGLGVWAYAVAAALGMRWLRSAAWRREAVAVVGLAAAAVSVQAAAQSGAPLGYGLAKWVLALSQKGSSGYFEVARNDARDLPRFLAEYPTWIQSQDALHIGTHPPGLIAAEALVLHAMEARPGHAQAVVDAAPESVATAFRVFASDHPMSPAERATITLTGGLTLLACALTVVPLYVLARATLDAPWAFAAAALWPLAPAAILFQPTADTAFPLLSTTALALAVQTRRPRLASLACGVVLGLGMQFTLVFLPVGLIVAVLSLWQHETPLARRIERIGWTGVGFLGLTLAVWAATHANPFAVWWWNQRNHARFYVEYPRSYGAWLVVNPIETAAALGLATAVWCLVGLAVGRRAARVSLTTAFVLVVLTLMGRSLSEVGRLWLPFHPALLVAAGAAMQRVGAGPVALGALIALAGVEVLALQALIQVVYPV